MTNIQETICIRVLLDVEPGMLRELLSRLLDKQPGIEIAGAARDPVDLLVAVAEADIDMVVQSWKATDQIPEVCTHLFAEYPELEVIGIPPDASCICVCRQGAEVTRLPTGSLNDVVAAIRKEALQDASRRDRRSGGKSKMSESPRHRSGV